MGLPLDENGCAILEPSSHDDLFANPLAQEETAFHALLRLMCQLINCEHTQDCDQSQRQALLNTIEEDLEAWHRTVGLSLRPDVELSTSLDPLQEDLHRPLLHENWYSSDRYAVATGYYYMARMLLTIQRPIESFRENDPSGSRAAQPSTPYDLLRAMKLVQQALASFAKETLPLALAAPVDSVRVRLIQPLYVAGRSFSQKQDQEMLLRLLRDIEADLGVFTQYRVDDLRREWGNG